MAEEMNMDEMGERPPMPEMNGANISKGCMKTTVIANMTKHTKSE